MDKIDRNIYELKSEFKDFKETVVGFIDSLSKRPNKDSPTGRLYPVSKFKFNNCVRLTFNLIVV
ncbi:hypothetical protein WN944_018601 [Citrus x changshan-huyou]|uniref:Uncharacterized protein n=1 Tax=Citrus x changshan-huyou TaxID=2935761 RepID=A0AAP0LYE6_9ROSI